MIQLLEGLSQTELDGLQRAVREDRLGRCGFILVQVQEGRVTKWFEEASSFRAVEVAVDLKVYKTLTGARKALTCIRTDTAKKSGLYSLDANAQFTDDQYRKVKYGVTGQEDLRVAFWRLSGKQADLQPEERHILTDGNQLPGSPNQ